MIELQKSINQAYVKEDEELKIGKLQEHLNMKMMLIEIGTKAGINVRPTYGDDSNGDVVFSEGDKDQLVEALDEYLHQYKVE